MDGMALLATLMDGLEFGLMVVGSTVNAFGDDAESCGG
jgi:hypothetical protein